MPILGMKYLERDIYACLLLVFHMNAGLGLRPKPLQGYSTRVITDLDERERIVACIVSPGLPLFARGDTKKSDIGAWKDRPYLHGSSRDNFRLLRQLSVKK